MSVVKNGIRNGRLRDELGTDVPLVCVEKVPAMVRELCVHREVPVEERQEEDLHLFLSAVAQVLSSDSLR